MNLSEYAINAAERYWPIEDVQYDGRVVAIKQKFWTLTVHEPHCRFAQKDKNGNPIRAYFGSDGLRNLASRGLTPPTSRYTGSVWQGCKVCGTASQPNENWKARGQAVIDADRAADASRRKQWEAEALVSAAKDAYEKAQRDARHEWIEAHKAEITGVELEAAAEWIAANPERAKLLTEPTA